MSLDTLLCCCVVGYVVVLLDTLLYCVVLHKPFYKYLYMAFNYWMHPPSEAKFDHPYEDKFWEEKWTSIAKKLGPNKKSKKSASASAAKTTKEGAKGTTPAKAKATPAKAKATPAKDEGKPKTKGKTGDQEKSSKKRKKFEENDDEGMNIAIIFHDCRSDCTGSGQN